MFPFRVKRLLCSQILRYTPRGLSCSLRSCFPCLKKNWLVKTTTKKQEACVVLHVAFSPCIFTLIGCFEICHDSSHGLPLSVTYAGLFARAGMSAIWFSRGDCCQAEVLYCRKCANSEQAIQQGIGISFSFLFGKRATKNPVRDFLLSVPHSELQQCIGFLEDNKPCFFFDAVKF